MARRTIARKPVLRREPPPPKVKQPPPANLPQHELPAPYARLLTLGSEDDPDVYDEIAAELNSGDPHTAAARLLEMTLDETYYDYHDLYKNPKDYEDDPRPYTRWHALNVLTRLGEAAHIGIEPLLPLLNEEDDFLREELPHYYAAMGAPAIESLMRVLMDPEAETFARVGAGESLQEIGEAHPDLRDRIISLLEQAMLAENEDDTVVGFLVWNLMDLGAKESYPLIKQAYEEDRVDPSIVGELADVEEHFGLPITSPRKGWKHWAAMADNEEDEEELFDEEMFPMDHSLTPAPVPEKPYVAPVKAGRNDPCPCGSGKKYKKCCGANA